MATHADIYIPIKMENDETKYLYCEAWSDGYFSGMGYAMLASSNHMKDVIKLNTIFAGSPFYYDPATQQFEAKECDYIEENFEESSEDEELVESAIQCVNYVYERDLEKVYQSKFAQIPLDTKLKEGLGINAEIKPLEEVLGNSKIVVDIEEIINFLKIKNDEHYQINSAEYLYHENQWLVKVYDDEKYVNSIYIPMIIGLLNFTQAKTVEHRHGCFVDPFSYIEQGSSEKDLKTMKALYQHNMNHNIDMSKNGWANIQEYVEKMILDEKIATPNTTDTKIKL